MSESRLVKYLRLITKRIITKETTFFAWLETSLKKVNAIYWITFLGIVAFFLLMVIVFDNYSKQYYASQKIDSTNHKSVQSNVGYCNIDTKNLAHCNFSHQDLRKSDFKNANLTEANLSYADLSGVDLSGANLTGANLNYADLSGADLSNAKLVGATLVNANLSEYVPAPSKKNSQKNSITKLKNADLTGASLMNANLYKADLSGATTSLKDAIISNANLSYAQLQGLDLTKVLIIKSNRILKVREPRDSPFRDYFKREIIVIQRHKLMLEELT